MAYTWQLLAPNWGTLTDIEKIALFEGTAGNVPTGAELLALGAPFRVAVYDSSSTGQNLYVEGIPKRQLVKPNSLISTARFLNISNISLDFAISGDGDIKIAVTTDLIDYYVYNTSTNLWEIIDIDNDIDTNGMTPTEIGLLSQSDWSALDLSSGVAFAYSLDITNDTDEADIDKLEFTGTANGTWVSQVKGNIFDYEYVGDNILRVHIYDDGDYKINYKRVNDGGAGEGSDYTVATTPQIDALFI